MGYPVGPLLRTLGHRILSNLDLVDARAPQWGESNQNDPPFADTQLLISLLGVLVFPHERTPRALGDLFGRFGNLSDIITIIYPTTKTDSIHVIGVGGSKQIIDATTIHGLIRFLRNGIAHFNIRPIDKSGRFGGIRVWNEDEDGMITLVADFDFDAFRPLARHVLKELAESQRDLQLEDPKDPIEILKEQQFNKQRKARKAPRIPDTIWVPLLRAHEGNYDKAKTCVDRLLRSEAKRLLTLEGYASLLVVIEVSGPRREHRTLLPSSVLKGRFGLCRRTCTGRIQKTSFHVSNLRGVPGKISR